MAVIGIDIRRSKNLLNVGELVAIPTETVYGLAANALNENAVVKIFEAKNRPAFDPLIVHVEDADEFHKYAKHIPEAAMSLASKICPGPITFVFDKKSIIPDLVTSGHKTVALRVPDHILTRRLLRTLDFPLAAPSANMFGQVSPTTAFDVYEQLGDSIPYILDGGSCQIGLESTILDFSNNRKRVLRLGGMSLELLEEHLGESLEIYTSSSNPKSPGQLQAHYSPGKKVIAGNMEELLKAHNGQKVGLLLFQHRVKEVDPQMQIVLSDTGNVLDAARNFFTSLRALAKLPVDVILAEWLPDEGLGKAMNDRLKRASATKV